MYLASLVPTLVCTSTFLSLLRCSRVSLTDPYCSLSSGRKAERQDRSCVGRRCALRRRHPVVWPAHARVLPRVLHCRIRRAECVPRPPVIAPRSVLSVPFARRLLHCCHLGAARGGARCRHARYGGRRMYVVLPLHASTSTRRLTHIVPQTRIHTEPSTSCTGSPMPVSKINHVRRSSLTALRSRLSRRRTGQ